MLFVGDDWAEDHHDVELQDAAGGRVGGGRLVDGVEGIARLHAMIAEHLADGADVSQVAIGIETDRGPWVRALVAAGYRVYAINPLQAARYRERGSVSGAKSDVGDAHVLADMVRTDGHQLRLVAGDSDLSEAIKVVARAHQNLVRERTRHLLRLRQGLLSFFPAALTVFPDLAAAEALELLAKAPDPAAAARLRIPQISAALKRAGRRKITERAHTIQAGLRSPQLTQPDTVATAYAVTVRAQVRLLAAVNTEIEVMAKQVETHFGEHPDVEIYLSQPGLGNILGARVLAEFGDDNTRYLHPRARKNYAGTSPITRQSGKRKIVSARHVHNDRLIDALGRQAFAALTASPGARAYYDQLRAHGASHHAALRQLANRLVGILHGCLKTRTHYNETTAWSHRIQTTAA